MLKEIDRIASLNYDNIEEQDEDYEETVKRWKEDSPQEYNIICVQCKDRVGKFVPRFTDLPLRGSMIQRHVGTEAWPLPLPHHGPRDFVCPHAQFEGGDMHLFVNVVEGRPDDTDSFLTDKNEPYQITKSSGECPCGCGGRVRGKNKYSDGLNCYKLHVAQLKKETD
jgi:hypothetical protein